GGRRVRGGAGPVSRTPPARIGAPAWSLRAGAPACRGAPAGGAAARAGGARKGCGTLCDSSHLRESTLARPSRGAPPPYCLNVKALPEGAPMTAPVIHSLREQI